MAGMLNINEIEEYAKEKGFDSLEFLMMTKNGRIFNGKFLDAYYGFISIPDLGDGFIMLKDLVKQHGFDFFSFIPLNADYGNEEDSQ